MTHTHTSTEQERAEFEAWAQSEWACINLLWQDRFSRFADYDTQSKWISWQAARRATVVPQGYEHGMLTGNRVILDFDTQENADLWFDKFCDSYDAAPPQLLANHAEAKR